MQKVLFSLLWMPFVCAAAGNEHWVVTWGTSPSPQLEENQMRAAKLIFDNQTVREIVSISLGASTIRIRLSNAYGGSAVQVGEAHIALVDKGSATLARSDRTLTFGGRSNVMIPPDGIAVSDPVLLEVSPGSKVAVSLFLPLSTIAGGVHYAAQQTTFIAPGNVAGAMQMPDATTLSSWAFLNDLDVLTNDGSSTLVAFGDSITDGAHSSMDADHRWPNFLSRRLADVQTPHGIGILNAGIGGNRILHDGTNRRFGVSALARYDRDVMAAPGLKYVVIMEGINDLGHPGSSAPTSEIVSAADIIAALQQLIQRTHEGGAKILGATLTPFEGTVIKGYFTAEKEAKRKALNDWIRSSHAFDGVLDFDQAIRDPHHPDSLLPAFDSGDHLHPNDAGYKAMAESVDLSLFR